ncbi:MAG TPA: hypothetical protein VGF45_13710, partial [Polyangia bacterium]
MTTPGSSNHSPTRRLRLTVQSAAALAVLALALFEAGAAVVAPRLSPTDQDWAATTAFVNQGFKEGDLIVAAPAWADPVLRQHLGDRLPAAIAGRLDHERCGRIWEISQRGADADETAGGRIVQEQRFGNLRARLFERSPQVVTYDFTARWREARLSRETPGQPPTPCELQPSQHQCPDFRYNFVRDALLEIGGGIRQALYAQPVANAAVVLEYPTVTLG